jgi:hypothetical protein
MWEQDWLPAQRHNLRQVCDVRYQLLQQGHPSIINSLGIRDCLLEEIALACSDTRIRPSLTLVLTGPNGRIGGLEVTALY